MFSLDFLGQIHAHLFDYLDQLFKSKRCVCLILNNKFHYVWKDWFNGENYRVSLSDAIAHKENNDVNIIKNNNCHLQNEQFYFFFSSLNYIKKLKE